MKLVLQSQVSECGLACIAMLANFHGHKTDLASLRRRFPVSSKGMTLQQLMACASLLGLSSRPIRVELDELQAVSVPCILHWDLNHFVVLRSVSARGVVIFDPANGIRKLRLAELSRHFTGIALESSPNASFEAVKEAPRIRLRQLTGKVFGLKRALLNILAVSLGLQLFAIAAPFFNQVVIDEVIASHDADLLTVLLIGFGLLLVIQTLLGLARSWMVMVLSQAMSLQWSANVFAHLVKLPLDWFEQRHVGDITSRFGSVDSIQRTLTTSAIESILDGIMATAALAMMFLYAPQLAAVTVVAVSGYGLIRWAFYGPQREATAERLVLAAREHSHFLETVRAVTPVKLFGREEERRSHWQNLRVDVQNRDVRTSKLSIAFATMNTLIFGVENLVVFWLGARLIMQGQSNQAVTFTVGMLFAFVSYKSQFTQRVAALINNVVEMTMLRLHAERLSDIALCEPEHGHAPESELTHLLPSLELRGVSFRYGEGEPWVLKNVNLVVRPGDHLAIIGPSGGGKTTLLKVLLGLLPAAEGEVLYGGVPVRQLGLVNVRRRIGTVMQDDALLSGSIADNISFFDSGAEVAQLEASARVAHIHEDIVRMPMAYQTLVGDLGSGLSGGQKQRLLLARALYKRPSVLALDEATSHLDIASERAVTDALSKLRLTRLAIAHRPETIAGAQRVVVLQHGKVTEVLPPGAAGDGRGPRSHAEAVSVPA